MAAAIPASAAVLNGRRRVMTETSDFAQIQSGFKGPRPAGNAGHRRLASGLGSDRFHPLLLLAAHPAEQYRAYCDYVGRLNADSEAGPMYAQGAALLSRL